MAQHSPPARYLQDLTACRPATEPTTGYVEVIDEPRHYHRFENDYVRVYDVRFEPGESSLYHRHAVDTLYVTIFDATVDDQLFQADNGQALQLPAGLSGCRPHLSEPLVHRIRNDGGSLVQMIGAEYKKSPPTVAPKPLVAAHHTQVADPYHSECIRLYRLELDPGESTGPVHYEFSGLLVSISDANVAIDAGTGGTQVMSFAPGAHLWHDGPITRSLKNVGETRFTAMLGEWC